MILAGIKLTIRPTAHAAIVGFLPFTRSSSAGRCLVDRIYDMKPCEELRLLPI